MGQIQYKQGQEFQTKIVALMLQDPAFLVSYWDVLDPRFFAFDTLSLLTREIIKYFEEYGKPPSFPALTSELEDYIFRNRLQDSSEEILNTVDYCFRINLDDGQYIKNKIITFGKTMALKQALSQAVDILENQEDERYDEIPKMMHEALAVGMSLHRKNFDFNEFLQDPVAGMQQYTSFSDEHLVKTPWQTINQYTHDGLNAGQLGIVMAGSGIGKSIALINMAHHAATRQEDKFVYYFAIGDLKEPDIGLRYISRLFDMPEEIIKFNKDPGLLQRNIKKHAKEPHPLEIAYFSPGQVTVQTIRSYITKKMVDDPKRFKPGLVIIDYMDNLLPARHKGEGTYLEMGSIAEDMISLGDDFLCPVWSATQPQRWGLTTDLLDVEKVGESWKKIAHADIVLTVNQSADGKAAEPPRATLYLAKVRRGKSKEKVEIMYDPTRMIMKEFA